MSRDNRPSIVGPDTLEPPYPLRVHTTVIPGFGRGSADLGIPTANIPQDAFDALNIGDTGIYYGWAKVSINEDHKSYKSRGTESPLRTVDFSYGSKLGKDSSTVFPMVMSVGWNPFYGNKIRSAEIHIIHSFDHSFYGAVIDFMIVGYIRPELNYVSKEALIADIHTDIAVALRSLERPGYQALKEDSFFTKA